MTTDTSSDRTQQVKEEGKQLTEEAKAKGQEVGRQAKTEASRVLDDAREKAREQAEGQTHRAAGALRGVADQLDSMAGGVDERGVVVGMAENGADRIRRLADHLDEAGIDGVMRDIESFARRRPGLYVAAGVGLGMLAGRLLRATDMDRIKQAMTEGPDGGAGRPVERPAVGTTVPSEPVSPTILPGSPPLTTSPGEHPGGPTPGTGL